MSERIRGGYDDALYKSTYTLLTYFTTAYIVQVAAAVIGVLALQRRSKGGNAPFLGRLMVGDERISPVGDYSLLSRPHM